MTWASTLRLAKRIVKYASSSLTFRILTSFFVSSARCSCNESCKASCALTCSTMARCSASSNWPFSKAATCSLGTEASIAAFSTRIFATFKRPLASITFCCCLTFNSSYSSNKRSKFSSFAISCACEAAPSNNTTVLPFSTILPSSSIHWICNCRLPVGALTTCFVDEPIWPVNNNLSANVFVLISAQHTSKHSSAFIIFLQPLRRPSL